VYVYDDYEGFTVKRFVDLDDAELERYTQMNVSAMTTMLQSFQPDVVITGHEVMGPYIAKLACGTTGHRYIAKLHGSALEYAVKLQERYLHFASEGLGEAHRVVGGSNYMLAEAASVVPGWGDRTRVVNPGVDIDLFRRPAGKRAGTKVAFVGKLIAEKGAHNLLVALGATTTPEIDVVIVGYGGDEGAIRALATHLAEGDREGALGVVAGLKHGEAASRWLRSATDAQIERFSRIPIEFTGRLEHGPLSKLLPTFDVLVVPSVVPEAFGMVAAEAAACGVLPLVPDHSGIAEAGAAVEHAIEAPGALTYDASDPVGGIARGIDRILEIPAGRRDEMGALAAEIAKQRWSWETVGRNLLEAAV
jgi:glycosyltransferase involved in cell wall biosynthesis